MDDRELLELAAKAAGYWNYQYSCYIGPAGWNTLENLADTLELEIKLKLSTAWLPDVEKWRVLAPHDDLIFTAYDKDRQRATTLCAAEIGKTL